LTPGEDSCRPMKYSPQPSGSNRPESPRLFLDKEGRWYHEGVQITHQRTCQLFSKSLHKHPDGDYYLHVGPERTRVELEDTPYLVRSVTVEEDHAGSPQGYRLSLSDQTEELLDPRTLTVGKGEVLYCSVKSGQERGRFLRSAYYQLCSRIEYDEARRVFWLPLKQQRIEILHPDHDLGGE